MNFESTANLKDWYENFGWNPNRNYGTEIDGQFCRSGYSCFYMQKIRKSDCD